MFSSVTYVCNTLVFREGRLHFNGQQGAEHVQVDSIRIVELAGLSN